MALKKALLHTKGPYITISIYLSFITSLAVSYTHLLYKAFSNVSSPPKASPVDFISGPKVVSTLRSFAKEKTGALTKTRSPSGCKMCIRDSFLCSLIYIYHLHQHASANSFIEIVVKFIDSNTFNIALAVSKLVKQLTLFSAATRRIKKPSIVTSFFCDMVLMT